MRRYGWLIALVVLVAAWWWSQHAKLPESLPAGAPPAPNARVHAPLGDAPQTRAAGDAVHAPNDAARLPAWLPDEARDTLRLIAGGGPFPHRQDGAVFQNRERRLPAQPRGYYREYTVRTPGARDRGARRIIVGGDPPVEFFYSDDHYRSFRRFDADASSPDARR